MGVLMPKRKSIMGQGTALAGVAGAVYGGASSPSGDRLQGAASTAKDWMSKASIVEPLLSSNKSDPGGEPVGNSRSTMENRIKQIGDDPITALKKASIAMDSAPPEIRDTYSKTIDDALKSAQADRRYV